ncbi:MAG TPA: BA14K family protein [Rhizobiaceae bacterium]|nr:BA14K family protein [Rhizobiaceae bacterium]
MRKIVSTICAAVLSMASLAAVGSASAAPVRPMGIEHPASDVQQVQHRRGYYRYHGRPYYNGYRGYRYARPGWRRHNDWWFPPAAFITGAIVGGALAAPPPPPPPVYRTRPVGNAHVQWCYDRYKSYRASDNTFQPYNGPRRQCYSPYS